MEGGGCVLKLIVDKSNGDEQKTLEFQPGSVVKIGRVVRGNTLAVKDSGISSKHLSIEFVSSEWILSDLDSSNGTIVNGKNIGAGNSIKLRDGDAIKIGELTTIKVWIEVRNVESTVRRNPKRRAVKDLEQSTVGISGTRSRRGGDLASTVGKKELGLGFAGVAEGGVRRGRPRKVVALTDDSQESLQAVVEVGNLGIDGPVKADQTGQLSKRTTRSSKNEQKTKSRLLPPLSSTVVCSTFEEEGVPAEIVEKKKTRGRKRKVDNDPPLKVINEVFAENSSVKDSQFGKEDAEIDGMGHRSSKNDQKTKSSLLPPLSSTVVCSTSEEEGVPAEIVEKKTRGRRKRKVDDDPPLKVRNEVFAKNCIVKDSQFDKEDDEIDGMGRRGSKNEQKKKSSLLPPLTSTVVCSTFEEGVPAEIVEKKKTRGRKRKVDNDPPLKVINEVFAENCSVKDSQFGKEDAEIDGMGTCGDRVGTQMDVQPAEEKGPDHVQCAEEEGNTVGNQIDVQPAEEGVPAEIMEKKTRGGGRRKRKLDDDPPLKVRNKVFAENCSVNDSQFGKEDDEIDGMETCGDTVGTQMDVQSAEEEGPDLKKIQSAEEEGPDLEKVQSAEEEGPDLEKVQSTEEEGPDLEKVQSAEEGPDLENVQPTEEGPDLEKMTLGQWFDYLEVYLPKQINAAAEEMISNMKAKAEKFNDFMLQQKNEKQKG